MTQLATEGAGFGPKSMGVPRADDNNTKTYVYDIDHRTNLCIAQVHILDIDAVLVDDTPECPVPTGATISSVTGGVIQGYDMYGQYIEETVAAAGTSNVAFYAVVDAPADALWANEFGLPYRHASSAAAPANVTYVAPTGLNGRGTFTWGSTFPATVTHNYTVERTNMFGDVRSQFASGAAIADVTMVGTINSAGAIAITQTLVADGSSWAKFTVPDEAGSGRQHVVANGASTINLQLSPLWLQKYARAGNEVTASWVDQLVRGVTENGTNIIVDLTGSPQA